MLRFLSCKFHIYPAAFNLSEPFKNSLEGFLSVCFLVIAFNLKTGWGGVHSKWDIPLVDLLCFNFKINTSTINEKKISFEG